MTAAVVHLDQADASAAGAFSASLAVFEEVVGWSDAEQAGELTHAELEAGLGTHGRRLLCQLQDHLELRAVREERLAGVVDVDGVGAGKRRGRPRARAATVFGQVTCRRTAYRKKGHANLHVADAALILPRERRSHGLRRLAATEASRDPFDGAVAAVERATGQQIGKRGARGPRPRAATDFEDFYADRAPPLGDPGDALALSADGKGIVMRPDALREATAKAAAEEQHKLKTRLSRGEKRNRKRMATVTSATRSHPPRAPPPMCSPATTP